MSFVACGDDPNGALLVLHNEIGGATKIEVILASPDDAERLEAAQRKALDVVDQKPVIYFRQRSTSMPVELDGVSTDGFAIRLEPNPEPEMFFPFVLVYDDNDTLLGAGRIGDADPLEIKIPKTKLDQYDVALEAMTPFDTGDKLIAPGLGQRTRCTRDQSITGVVMTFTNAKQARVWFPTETWGPFDFDCDDYDVQFQDDCNDLVPDFHPDSTKEGVCEPIDYNCDQIYGTEKACKIPVTDPTNPQLNLFCDGVQSCDNTVPCHTEETEGNCRCVAAQCLVGTCQVPYSVETGAATQCSPPVHIATMLGACKSAPCDFELKSPSPMGWTVEIGYLVTNGGAMTVFDGTNKVTLNSVDAPLLVRATTTDANFSVGTNHPIGPIDIAVSTGSGMRQRWLYDLRYGSGTDGCTQSSVDTTAKKMTCSAPQ